MERTERRRLDRSFSGIELPRERLLAVVIDQDLRRPQPRGRLTPVSTGRLTPVSTGRQTPVSTV
jgi:hypothetical protein